MKSTVTKTVLPEISSLNGKENRYDYQDSYCVTINDPKQCVNPATAMQAMTASTPAWIASLMKLRNSIVGVFGLKTGDMSKKQAGLPDAFSLQPGMRVGPFRVISSTPNELVAGDEDKHLDFKVSLLVTVSKAEPQSKDITLTTVVWYNNFFGRFYFFFVKPFHRLIVKASLRVIRSRFENENAAYK